MEYRKHVSEPWFSLIYLGIKTVEGRLNKGDFSKMRKGDKIIFENNDFNIYRSCQVRITNINKYDNFKNYLEKEKLAECLPTVICIADGLKIYYNYFSKQDEN